LDIAKYYFTIPFFPSHHFVYGGVLEINRIVMVCLYTYISIKHRYSRVTITIVPSVACQHTEVILQILLLPSFRLDLPCADHHLSIGK